MRNVNSLTTGLTRLFFLICSAAVISQGAKPPLTLDDFFNSVDLSAVRISPDGRAVVIQTNRPDWVANRFRSNLWLYRDADSGRVAQLVQLTQSGHDSAPEWSPDGLWIAFLSDRKGAARKPAGVMMETKERARRPSPRSI